MLCFLVIKGFSFFGLIACEVVAIIPCYRLAGRMTPAEPLLLLDVSITRFTSSGPYEYFLPLGEMVRVSVVSMVSFAYS